ncbi:MAG: septum formation initiator family protein [Lachnospiraceae bacterium]|nr:septum formation initiator family protein [Lachnospiraceae bacterium]
MARKRRIAYRKKQQNRFSMFLVTLVVVMILVLAGVQSTELRDKIDDKRAESFQLDQEIAAEELRALEIEALSKEVQTKGYIENIAREKLGLVYEDEILFKQQ